MIRTFIICQEEPFFIPKQIELITRDAGVHYSLVGASVLSPTRKGRGIGHWFRERARVYRKRELLWTLLAYASCKTAGKLGRLLGRPDPYSVKGRLREAEVPILGTSDIENPAFLRKLREIGPDLIVSISCPQLFPRELLELPDRYCINLHATLLPRHRGVFGTWWTLYEGDEEAGASIHTMEEKLDAGELLWQEAFPVKERDTQFYLAHESKRRMAEGLTELLRWIDRGEERPLPRHYEASYHRAPTRAEGSRFKRSGKRIIRGKDLPSVLRTTFGKGGRREETP
jgi:folate-dependent phosphoribosylglycinamide formyltransferase PurN